jgi:hypothetical protein
MNDSPMKKPIIAIDFDGVIHDYRQGWQDGSIYGEVTEGFFAWAAAAGERFSLIIHSSRASTPEGQKAILDWLRDKADQAGFSAIAGLLDVRSTKPPAFLTIDDRCIRFTGDWSALDPAFLIKFKPWTAMEPAE